MRLLPFFVSLAAAETFGSWTISALSRQCTPSNTACTYNLTLTTHSNSSNQQPENIRQQQQQQQQQTCTFTITSPKPATQPASHTDFTAIPCHNSNPSNDPNPNNGPNHNNGNNNNNNNNNQEKYQFNGGYSPHPHGSFLTLVPTDTTDGSYAFFGYAEGELAGGRVGGVKEAVVYRGGEFGGSSASFSSSTSYSGGSERSGGSGGSGEGVSEGGSEGGGGGSGGGAAAARWFIEKRGGGRGRMRGGVEAISEGGRDMARIKVERGGKNGGEEVRKWQIKGLTRFPNPGANTTTWQFTIVHKGGRETHCSPTSPTSDPVASFYGIPCGTNDGADFKASWGYNGDADSAVMTLCYVPDGIDAWFGFEQVSHNQWLGDSKKEPVYYTGCG